MSITLALEAPEERYRIFSDHHGIVHLKCDQHGAITSPDGHTSITFEHAGRLIQWHEHHYRHAKEGNRGQRDAITGSTASRRD